MNKFQFIHFLTICFAFLAPLISLYIHTKKSPKSIQLIFALIYLVFLWSTFLEPNLIRVKEHQISTNLNLKVAIAGDFHLGVYKDQSYLKRVVQKINQIPDLDLLLIPGDFTFYPNQSQPLSDLFKPLENLNVPAIAVLGNHDVEKPGPKLRDELTQVLESYQVNLLNNQTYAYENIQIIGLGDHWALEDNVDLLKNLNPNSKSIILTHNPDTTLNYSNPISQLTISGHTHGGQIRIPFLYKFVIPTKGNFNQGLHQTKNGPVFVNTGLGEVDLPMRFLIPPTIDILNL